MHTNRLLTSSTAATALCALALAASAQAKGPTPTPPGPFTPPPTGTLAVCHTSGPRPVTVPLSFTFAAPASAGGTQTVTIAAGTCSAQIFYPQGVTVVVTENVPTGDSVAGIAISGGQSTLASSSPAAGSATVTIGPGQSLVTFTTNGPARNCIVPNVVGLALTAATTAVRAAHCTVGVLHRVYSKTVRAGRVISESPRAHTTLAPSAPVDLVVSRGRRP